jgi:hypothetical protein
VSESECDVCGKEWRDHYGPIALCRQLQIIRQIVSKFKRGKLSPRETIKAIEEVLK